MNEIQDTDVQFIWDLALSSYRTDELNLPVDETGILHLFNSSILLMNSDNQINLTLNGESITNEIDGQTIDMKPFQKLMLSQYLVLSLLQNQLFYTQSEKDILGRDFVARNVAAKIVSLTAQVQEQTLKIERTKKNNMDGWEF
ncbi:hypothetical protein Q5427_11375 [Brochothrix thermosphacta]|uniref:hypothetical protein n=1 Tax=Brochothrix thermosphacta TaxID=2756 RepID=UPI002713C53D|nr:hypothetical protein [Brochothrix thermosphacta]MDO7864890.1 hypothetical protein [Brochothrix thermosphacta]